MYFQTIMSALPPSTVASVRPSSSCQKCLFIRLGVFNEFHKPIFNIARMARKLRAYFDASVRNYAEKGDFNQLKLPHLILQIII